MEYLPPLCATILEEVDLGIIIVNEQLNIHYLNNYSLSILKCSKATATGKNLSNLLFGESPLVKIHDGYMKKIMVEGIKPSYSMANRIVDYRDMKLQITLHPLPSLSSSTMCMAIITDKTGYLDKTEQINNLTQEIQKLQAEKLSVQEQILINTSDTRSQIIKWLIAMIIIAMLNIQIVSFFDSSKVNKKVEDLIPAIFSTLVLCIGFYFNKSDS